ncbi:hypothetical protein B0H13DRAFT_1952924, partial [Mycena leptocephala]
MQFKFQLSALFITLALGLVSATPAAEGVVAERSVFNDCFNLGFEDGVAAGCNPPLATASAKKHGSCSALGASPMHSMKDSTVGSTTDSTDAH